MPDERLYKEEEVKKIFEAASVEPDSREQSASPRDALTLRELQEIGRQVGIAPDRIADAALAIDTNQTSANPYGVSVSVRRTVALPRGPTEAEWLVVVTELRDTFNATGRIGSNRGIHEWSNGNLRVHIEPTAEGHRLRMQTQKGSAMALGVAGAGALAWGALSMVGLLFPLASQGSLTPVIGTVIGVGLLGSTLFRLPKWGKTRAEQMEHIARFTRGLLSREPKRD